jgi:hypothetical protein
MAAMTTRKLNYIFDEYRALTFGDYVNTMSNWQRSQWARAGYPGLAHKVLNEVLPFAVLGRTIHKPRSV